MNFSSKLCNLSKPVVRLKSDSRNDYYKKREEYFNKHLKNRKVSFEGKETVLVFSELPGDRCFKKFAFGSEQYHMSKDGRLRYDEKRLERLDWIFEILENVSNCKKCEQYQIVQDKNYKDRINIYCMFGSYKIVIVLKQSEKQNVIVTAFYIRNDDEKKHKKRKRTRIACS